MNKLKNKILTIIAVLVFSSVSVTAGDPSKKLTKLEKEVRSELISLPRVGVFDNLEFKVEGNTVTLYGQVVEPSSRKNAERFVSKIEGVTNVINNIEVLPLSGFDDRIRAQAFRSIYNQAGLYRYLMGNNPSLRIVVKRGHVTLEGIVSDKTDAQLAVFAVRSLPDVFSVTSNLRTEKGRKL